MPRLQKIYNEEITPKLKEEFGYTNPMQVPKISKVSLNMGLGEAVKNPKLIDGAVKDLTKIAGQKPVITRARRSIATFKLREGMPIGLQLMAPRFGEDAMFHAARAYEAESKTPYPWPAEPVA